MAATSSVAPGGERDARAAETLLQIGHLAEMRRAIERAERIARSDVSSVAAPSCAALHRSAAARTSGTVFP